MYISLYMNMFVLIRVYRYMYIQLKIQKGRQVWIY